MPESIVVLPSIVRIAILSAPPAVLMSVLVVWVL